MIGDLRKGFETAFIDGNLAADYRYKPAFVSNNPEEGKKVIASIEDELLACDKFQISVAFITMGGITPLLQTLKELETKGIPGEILTTNYLNFSEPTALEKLHGLKNITLKMFDVETAETGFHTKGYIFKKEEIYRIIIGSSNITSAALTQNHEWNTRIVSTDQGEVAKNIVAEFNKLWNSPYSLEYEEFFDIYKERYQIIKHQREIAKQEQIPSIERYRLQPNSMQVGFIVNLKKIIEAGESKALLISATGTGKTYASAFAMRELGFKRVLFLVHRGQLARQTKKSYEKIFQKSVSMGLIGAGYHEYDNDYIFAIVNTLYKDEHLYKYDPEYFDCIIFDEAHHSSADMYQKVMNYFRPRFYLGMTATPDKKENMQSGKNIYEIYNHQIAYEIRLRQAMEEQLLCPFHYFGISDLSIVGDEQHKSKNLSRAAFNQLVSDERVRHIIEQAKYYGYSGDRVKGIIFCSRIDESIELSNKFNEAGYRTIALNGDASEDARAEAFERLAMDEQDADSNRQPLDYIFSVDILNEGVDIVEINQVIMLRPTESPIVFIQQLGRGLRKANGKEYVVILDFIGNYEKNFLIPIALSGDRSYNADTIRKYVISGNSTIPGASTVHFDAIAKEKIFQSIDKIKGLPSIIKESYQNLKNRLGRIPYLMDFYENEEIDPLVIIREFKTYYHFLCKNEKDLYEGKLTNQEILTLEYFSKTILSGVRPYELTIMQKLFSSKRLDVDLLRKDFFEEYPKKFNESVFKSALSVIRGGFVTNQSEYNKFSEIEVIGNTEAGMIQRLESYAERLSHPEFYRQMEDLIQVGLRRYKDKYADNQSDDPFVLYEKYSRRDVCLLMNNERDISSVMYGMKRLKDDVFIFITYHKEEADDESKQYVDGKPDYADAFVDSMTFRWDSQIGRGIDSTYMQDVITAPRKHLLVKKSDAETSFYYMGMFDIASMVADTKKDNRNILRPITKVVFRMKNPVRADLLKYLESSLQKADETA